LASLYHERSISAGRLRLDPNPPGDSARASASRGSKIEADLAPDGRLAEAFAFITNPTDNSETQ